MFNALIKEGIIISLATFFGYLLTIMYQIGQINYYLLPVEFINLDAIKIFESIFVVGIVSFLIFLIFEITSELFYYKSIIFSLIIKYFFIFFAFSTIMTMPSNERLVPPLKILLAIVLIVSFIDQFLTPIFKYRSIKGFENKLKKAADDRMRKIRYFSINDVLFQNRRGLQTLLYTSIMIIPTIFFLGFNSMETNKVFHTLKLNNKDYVVASIKSENLILVQFDRKNKRLLNNFTVMSISRISDNSPIKYENLGQLQRYDITASFLPKGL